MTTRGERNNNPCNIRISDSAWLGKIYPSQDPDFEQFDNPTDGIRAAAKLFVNYQKIDGIKTVAGFIARWAPSSENDTNSYIGDVCLRVGVQSGSIIDLTNLTTLINLVSAVIWHENGENIYPRSVIAQACQEALA